MIYLGDKQMSIGARGRDGRSAYEAAKEGGYTGTEEDFNKLMASFLASENPAVTGTITKNTTSTVPGEIYAATKPTDQVAGDYWYEPIPAVNS